jgi:hypothetical protein
MTEFTDIGLWLLIATQTEQQRQCHSIRIKEGTEVAQATTPYIVHK